jgi:hypothetical protein
MQLGVRQFARGIAFVVWNESHSHVISALFHPTEAEQGEGQLSGASPRRCKCR